MRTWPSKVNSVGPGSSEPSTGILSAVKSAAPKQAGISRSRSVRACSSSSTAVAALSDIKAEAVDRSASAEALSSSGPASASHETVQRMSEAAHSLAFTHFRHRDMRTRPR